MSEPGDCKFEVSNFFECIEKHKGRDIAFTNKKCFSFLDDYYKCIDIRSYNKCQEVKRTRNLKKKG